MRRSEMIEKISEFAKSRVSEYGLYMEKSDCKDLLDFLEESGMLPPVNECRLVPDEHRGGMKHSETKREWDQE